MGDARKPTDAPAEQQNVAGAAHDSTWAATIKATWDKSGSPDSKDGGDQTTKAAAAAADSSGWSLVGLLKEAKDATVNLFTQIGDHTYTDSKGNVVKVVADSKGFSKYDFHAGGQSSIDLGSNPVAPESRPKTADTPSQVKEPGQHGYLDMNSGAVVAGGDKAASTDKAAAADKPKDSAAPQSAWDEIKDFFNFGKSNSSQPTDKKDVADSKEITGVKDAKEGKDSHEFRDDQGNLVKVEVQDGRATHKSSDGTQTVKSTEGVVRTDTQGETKWSPKGVEVTSQDATKHFTKNKDGDTLDWGPYQVVKLPGDQFKFTDKKTGEVATFDGDDVRKQVGPTVFRTVHGKSLDEALKKERETSGSKGMVALTDGQGNTLVSEPDGVKIYIKAGQRATATYPDGTQISADADGTRRIKTADGQITVLKPGEDPPKDLKLPKGVSFDRDGQLVLDKDGICIDKDGHLQGHNGLHVDMKHDTIELDQDDPQHRSTLTNKSGATTLVAGDGTQIKTDGKGISTVTSKEGETVTLDANKHELKTAAGTFHPDHVELWNGEKVYKDNSVTFSNGDKIDSKGAVSFADGTKFLANGTVTTGDGWQSSTSDSYWSAGNKHQDEGKAQRRRNIDQGAQASVADLNRDNVTEGEIGAAEASLADLDSLIQMLSARGQIGAAQQLAGVRSQLEGSISSAQSRIAGRSRQRGDSDSADSSTSKRAYSQPVISAPAQT